MNASIGFDVQAADRGAGGSGRASGRSTQSPPARPASAAKRSIRPTGPRHRSTRGPARLARLRADASAASCPPRPCDRSNSWRLPWAGERPPTLRRARPRRGWSSRDRRTAPRGDGTPRNGSKSVEPVARSARDWPRDRRRSRTRRASSTRRMRRRERPSARDSSRRCASRGNQAGSTLAIIIDRRRQSTSNRSASISIHPTILPGCSGRSQTFEEPDASRPQFVDASPLPNILITVYDLFTID